MNEKNMREIKIKLFQKLIVMLESYDIKSKKV